MKNTDMRIVPVDEDDDRDEVSIGILYGDEMYSFDMKIELQEDGCAGAIDLEDIQKFKDYPAEVLIALATIGALRDQIAQMVEMKARE